MAVPSHDWGPVSHSYFLVATCTGSFRDSQWKPPSFHPSLMYVMHFPTSLLFLPLSLCLAGPLLLIAIFPGVSLPTHVVLLVGILTRRLQPSYLSESLWPVGTHTLVSSWWTSHLSQLQPLVLNCTSAFLKLWGHLHKYPSFVPSLKQQHKYAARESEGSPPSGKYLLPKWG